MIVECVPNFSEGRDPSIVDSIAAAIASHGGTVLDRTSDWDHNRSVITFAAAPGDIAEAALAGIAIAVERIDLTRHEGVHPRIGAVDVVPVVPVAGIALDQCALIARRVGAEIWSRFRVPVYLYEAASPARNSLEFIRRCTASMRPDFGGSPHPTAGATVVGARKFLIAWNIHLATNRLDAAREIARKIRFSSGGLPCVKALGLPIASRNLVQVSINLTDFEVTPLHAVYAAVAREAHVRGIEIAGSELIGLVPSKALELSAGHNLQWQNLIPGRILENRLADTMK